jgi:LytR cell envelope-related transcriptional attenuator
VRGRHITTGITLVVLVGILAVGAVIGAKSLLAPIGDNAKATPSPTCTTTAVKKGQRIRPQQVQVSVFNAGTHTGMAQRTMSGLVKRGFRRGEVGNAPASAHVKRAQVWTRLRHDPAATLVARQLGKGTAVERKKVNLGLGVDVVIGDGFHALGKAPKAVVAKHPTSVCTPVRATHSPS